MKLRITMLALPLIITCSMAFADDATTVPTGITMKTATIPATVPLTNMTLSMVLQQLDEAGFVFVTAIRMEDGIYVATAVNKSDQAYLLNIDSKTGAILKQDFVTTMDAEMMANMPKISMQQAASNIEKAGYKRINAISWDSDEYYYTGEVIDGDGDVVDVQVDSESGDVNQA